MNFLQHLIVRHRLIVRTAWLIAIIALAACQPGDNAGGDGY